MVVAPVAGDAGVFGPANPYLIGIPECDEYIDLIISCADKMPEGTQKAFREAVTQMAKQFREMGQQADQMRKVCKQAMQAAQQSFKQMGCGPSP